jgi:hypothetical protein
MRRFLVWSVAALAAVVAVAGCGGDGNGGGNGGGPAMGMEAEPLDTSKIEAQIEENAGRFGNEDVAVDCPEDVPAEEGTSFECDVTLGSATGSVEVTLNAADGSEYNYDGKVEGDGVTTELSGQVS